MKDAYQILKVLFLCTENKYQILYFMLFTCIMQCIFKVECQRQRQKSMNFLECLRTQTDRHMQIRDRLSFNLVSFADSHDVYVLFIQYFTCIQL